MKERRRHPIWATISGFFLGLFVGLDLLFLGVIPLNSILLTILPIVGLILGLVLGLMGPLRKKAPKESAAAPAPSEPAAQYVTPPPVAEEAPVAEPAEAAAAEEPAPGD